MKRNYLSKPTRLDPPPKQCGTKFSVLLQGSEVEVKTGGGITRMSFSLSLTGFDEKKTAGAYDRALQAVRDYIDEVEQEAVK